MRKWEYLTQSSCKVEDLNKLGSEGWELINVTIPYKVQVDSINTTVNYNLYYIFKREILK